MLDFNKELRAAGELVGAEGLAGPDDARVVRADTSGAPQVSDGPFAEAKEFLAGYWIVDVDTTARAYELAARLGAPGQGRRSAEHANRGTPGDERASRRTLIWCVSTRRPSACCVSLTPQVLGAVMRRFRDFHAAEDAVQEALLAASTQWPREGLPANPRGWLIQVAVRRMTDVIRSESARRRREGPSPVRIPSRPARRPSSSLTSRSMTTRSCSSSCAAIPH